MPRKKFNRREYLRELNFRPEIDRNAAADEAERIFNIAQEAFRSRKKKKKKTNSGTRFS